MAPRQFNERGIAFWASFSDGSNGILVAQLSVELTADYNGNGIVEQADLDLVLLHWGTELIDPGNTGWINDLPSGTVDQEELDKVLLGWGNSVEGLNAASVPEPGTVILALLMAVLAAWMCRRRLAGTPPRYATPRGPS